MQAVREVAPVELVPELLLSSNYEEILDIDSHLPSLNSCLNWAAFAGKMKDDVWKSPLVQHLLKIDQLDALPWKEFLFNRFTNARRRNKSEVDSQIVRAERFGDLPNYIDDMKKKFNSPFRVSVSTNAQGQEPSTNAIVLPTRFRSGQTVRIETFKFYDWYNHLISFVPSHEYPKRPDAFFALFFFDFFRP